MNRMKGEWDLEQGLMDVSDKNRCECKEYVNRGKGWPHPPPRFSTFLHYY
jgi:hypothetical protein